MTSPESLNDLTHENRIGLPWIIVRLYKGSYGTQLEAAPHMDFNAYSRPRKDKTGQWLFSLKHNGEDTCMVRCHGMKSREYALKIINEILDEREGNENTASM